MNNASKPVIVSFRRIQPVASLIVAEIVGPCDPIELDPTASQGHAGHPWSVLNWTVSFYPDLRIAEMLESYLNSQAAVSKHTDSMVLINSTMLMPGKYSFSMYIENIYGGSAVAFTTVRVSNDTTVPYVRIDSPKKFQHPAVQPLSLHAVARTPGCSLDAAAELFYSWIVYVGAGLDTSHTLSSAGSAASSNPAEFILSPLSLDVSEEYTIQVFVSVLDALSGALGQSASASVLVITTAPQLSAVIDTGGQQVLSSLEPFYLSALASRSSDGDTTDSGIREEDLQFAWTCSQVDPDKFGMACPIKVGLPSLAGFTVPANLITFGTEQLLFEVTVTHTSAMVSDTASVLVSLVADSIPWHVSFLSGTRNRRPVSMTHRLVLTADVQVPEANDIISRVVWSSPSIPALDAIALSPTSASIPSAMSARLLLPPLGLVPGASYIFCISLLQTIPGSSQHPAVSTVSVLVNVNRPPRAGRILVSPTTGQALSTLFAISSSGWVDEPEDYPLRTYLGYQIPGLPYRPRGFAISSRVTPGASTSTVLPPGLSSEQYAVTCIAFALDVYGDSSAEGHPKTIGEFRMHPYTPVCMDSPHHHI